MKRLISTSLICTLFSSLSSLAFADTYLHGSVGEAEFSSGGQPDMYEIGMGFSLSPTLYAEISYVNLGAVDSGIGGGDFIEEEADGFKASLIADLPITETIGLYVSAGYLNWDDTARLYEGGYHTDTYVVEGGDWTFGAGLKAELSDGLNLKFGYTEYKLDDIEVDTVTAGIVYRF
jgi:opacity protein-like surface antigen